MLGEIDFSQRSDDEKIIMGNIVILLEQFGAGSGTG
jgi:hypothetical protein